MSCSQKKTPAEETYEICISCKEQTAVRKATPIDEREYYIRGCGQLCPACYRKISKPDNANKALSNGEIQYLIETSHCSVK